MKIDRFTKIVLTIIAINLMIISISKIDLIPAAYAGEPTNSSNPNPYLNYCLVPINEDGSINVKLISGNELDVNIVGIDTSDELDINIDEVGGSYVSSGGPISVEIDN